MQKEGQEQAVRICREQGIDALVVIGGDGSFRGALELSKRGIPCVGIPGTIDNDIAGSEYTIGFDTAVNTVMEMVDRLRDTPNPTTAAPSWRSWAVKPGIALAAGIACGAIAILVPEIEFDLERDVVSKMLRTMQSGKHHFIVIVAEGWGIPLKWATTSSSAPASPPAEPSWGMSSGWNPYCPGTADGQPDGRPRGRPA